MDSGLVTDEVVQVLEPNAMYYNCGADDDIRYYIGPEALEALGFVITSVVVPILTSLISDDLKERLKAARGRPEARREDLNGALDQASRGSAPQSDARRAATSAAAAVLFSYGWPQPAAEADATEIVDLITKSVWTPPT